MRRAVSYGWTDGRDDELSNRYVLRERAWRTVISLNGIHWLISVVETQCFACEGGTAVLKVSLVDMKFEYKVYLILLININ